MRRAIDEVTGGHMGHKEASVTFGVPQTTLERKIKCAKKNPYQKLKVSFGPKQTVFSTSEEEELVIYLKKMGGRLFGLTSKELRNLAFQLADKNGKHHPFDKEKEEAGMEWFRGFMKRHPDLSLRKPESTSAARVMGFKKVAVTKFFLTARWHYRPLSVNS
jgi:hypothetical protein